MKKSRFTDSQIAFILRQAEEGASVEEVCRKAGILPKGASRGASARRRYDRPSAIAYLRRSFIPCMSSLLIIRV